MKNGIIACFFACLIALGYSLEASLPNHHAVDICTLGNTRILLINTDRMYSFAANENSVDVVIDSDGGFREPACFFITPYDGNSAQYISSVQGRTSIVTTSVGKHGYTATPLDLDYSFNPYVGISLPDAHHAIFGLEEAYSPYDFTNEIKGKSMHIVWIDEQGGVLRQVFLPDIQPVAIHAALIDASNTIHVLVSTPRHEPGIYDYRLVQVDKQGTILRNIHIGKPHDGSCGAMCQNENGELFLYLDYRLIVTEKGSEEVQSDMHLIKLNSLYETIWQKDIVRQGNDLPIAILISSDGFLVGVSKSFNDTPLSTYHESDVTVFDMDGTELRQLNDNLAEYWVTPLNATFNASNDLIVVGRKEEKKQSVNTAYIARFSQKKLKGEQGFFWE